MAGDKHADAADGRPRPQGPGSGQEERPSGLQVPEGRERTRPDDMVRGGRERQRESSSTDQNLKDSNSKTVKPPKKLTLHEYRQTEKAAKAISKLNKKADLSEFVFSPTRRRFHSPTPSPPPSRVGVSPRGGGDEDTMDQRSVEATYGFMDHGGFPPKERIKTKTSTITSQQSLGNFAAGNANPTPTLAAGFQKQPQLQQTARSLINQGFHVSYGNDQAATVGAQQDLHLGHGPGVRQTGDAATGLPPVGAEVAMPRGDLFALLMMDMNKKYADMQQRQLEMFTNMNVNKGQTDATQKVPSDAAGSGSSNDEDSGDEGMPPSWSGLPPSSKTSSFTLSDSALAYWAELIAIDEQGKKDLRFKKLPKYPNKVKFYTEGDSLVKFRSPKLNQELAVTGGWRAKQEEDMIALQKLSGAAGSALCLTVDNLRGVMEDLVATLHDFKEGKFEDPGNEAEKVCASLIGLLEEGVISHTVDAIKFVSASFGAINLRRHSATLSQGYLSAEAKSVLDQSPPDEEYLFGQQVKESVQKIRDTSLIKDVFHRKPNYAGNKYAGKKNWIGNKYGAKGQGKPKKYNFRAPDQRFRKGRKRKNELDDPVKYRKFDKKNKDE